MWSIFSFNVLQFFSACIEVYVTAMTTLGKVVENLVVVVVISFNWIRVEPKWTLWSNPNTTNSTLQKIPHIYFLSTIQACFCLHFSLLRILWFIFPSNYTSLFWTTLIQAKGKYWKIDLSSKISIIPHNICVRKLNPMQIPSNLFWWCIYLGFFLLLDSDAIGVSLYVSIIVDFETV